MKSAPIIFLHAGRVIGAKGNRDSSELIADRAIICGVETGIRTAFEFVRTPS